MEKNNANHISKCTSLHGGIRNNPGLTGCVEKAKSVGANTVNYNINNDNCATRKCNNFDLKLEDHPGGIGAEYSIYTEVFACDFSF